MCEIIKKYRIPLKMQIVSWFLLNENIGKHVLNYNRLINIDEEGIALNTIELSEFYHVKYIDDKFDKWVNGLVQFLEPKLSRFVYDLETAKVGFDFKIIHKGGVTNKTILLKSEL